MTTTTAFEYRTRDATALDEEAVLAEMGATGWELIDLGAFKLHFRRPSGPGAPPRWEYARRGGMLGDRIRQEMREQGWEPCGQWTTYHYFKRTVPAAG